VAQVILLSALIRTLDLDSAAIDGLLDEARQQAERILSNSTGSVHDK